MYATTECVWFVAEPNAERITHVFRVIIDYV
jgi:hypothetical protein